MPTFLRRATACSFGLTFATCAALLSYPTFPAYSHSDAQVRYANAITGVDESDCSDPNRPCRTFQYVRRQAGKGDRICLSTGIYRVHYDSSAMISVKLFNPLVRVRGDCGGAGNLASAQAGNGRSIIVGLPREYSERLAELGLSWDSEGSELTPGLDANVGAPAVQVAQAASARRYVDGKNGVDDANCSNPNRPCKTIEYARGQANPGDQIIVAAGRYVVDPADVESLLSEDVTVLGGFSAVTAFVARAPEVQPTYVIGPSHEHRAAFAARGLILLQDAKGLRIPKTVEAREQVLESAPPQPGPVRCENGKAGLYPCDGVDFFARLALHQFSSDPSAANDIWGFVDLNDGKEYAIIGVHNGTAVVDVSDPSRPRLVNAIDSSDPSNPKPTGNVVPGDEADWRDIKVYQFFNEDQGRHNAYAYVTTDGPENGRGQLQTIDLSHLPGQVSLVKQQSNYRRAHNVYISNVDYGTGVPLSSGRQPYLYILGSNLMPAGVAAFMDLDKRHGAFRIYAIKEDPRSPQEVTVPPPGTFYVHDATTFLIDDERTNACTRDPGNTPPHNPCEVLIDYNENTVDIWDVTDKSDPIKLSSTSYENAKYTHSGWWTADKRHVFVHDEVDELLLALDTTLRVLKIDDLKNPGPIKVAWTGPTKAIDHNGFAKGDAYYMSNYLRGLTVLDISDPEKPEQIAFFDTAPDLDINDFGGAWGVYPYLPSGTIVVSDIQRGLFVLRRRPGE